MGGGLEGGQGVLDEACPDGEDHKDDLTSRLDDSGIDNAATDLACHGNDTSVCHQVDTDGGKTVIDTGRRCHTECSAGVTSCLEALSRHCDTSDCVTGTSCDNATPTMSAEGSTGLPGCDSVSVTQNDDTSSVCRKDPVPDVTHCCLDTNTAAAVVSSEPKVTDGCKEACTKTMNCIDADTCTKTMNCIDADTCTKTMNCIDADTCTKTMNCIDADTCTKTMNCIDADTCTKTMNCIDADTCTKTMNCIDADTCTKTMNCIDADTCTKTMNCIDADTCTKTMNCIDADTCTKTMNCIDADTCTKTMNCIDADTCTKTMNCIDADTCTKTMNCIDADTCTKTMNCIDADTCTKTMNCIDADTCTKTMNCIDADTCTKTMNCIDADTCTKTMNCIDADTCTKTMNCIDADTCTKTMNCIDADTCTKTKVTEHVTDATSVLEVNVGRGLPSVDSLEHVMSPCSSSTLTAPNMSPFIETDSQEEFTDPPPVTLTQDKVTKTEQEILPRDLNGVREKLLKNGYTSIVSRPGDQPLACSVHTRVVVCSSCHLLV